MTEDQALADFRTSLAEWLEANITPEVREARRASSEGEERLDVLRAWNARLSDAGWACVSWPARFGGRDADVEQQLAYLEEMSRAGAPGPVNTIGVSNIAPAIMSLGTEDQKERFLRPMLRGDEIWCQGMSEPDAGSDLASLRTAARLEGETFYVSGQKTWNSLGRHADWCQLYVRTDPDAPKHRGISCLLVDMATPGITVRPLRTMTGDFTFSELFLDQVPVPRSCLLGPLNEGWRVAMTTLGHERAGVARLHLDLTAKFQNLLAAGAPTWADHRRGAARPPRRLVRRHCMLALRHHSGVGQDRPQRAAVGRDGWVGQAVLGSRQPGIGRSGGEHLGSRGADRRLVDGDTAHVAFLLDRRRHQ